MAPSLTHIALHCEDLDACTAFYQDFCGMAVSHEREHDSDRVVWLAEPGREAEFVIVLLSGGMRHEQSANDFSHFGFALESREAVDAISVRARDQGRLTWEARQDPYPAGYHCGVADPNGNIVEFSFDQPLGPPARSAEN